MKRFVDQTVIVTGASRGLGRSIAEEFGREGAFVYVNYRTRETDAGETLELIRQADGQGALLCFDVCDRQAVDAAVKKALQERGNIDVLVNNAGIACDKPLAFMSSEDFDDVVGVNLKGTFNCCQAVVRLMLTKRCGTIVNIGSVAGLHASPGQANYAASKGGIIALTRTMAAELAPRGVRVNAVVPGLLSTGLAQRLDHRIAEQNRARIPMGRFGAGEEVARVVVFVASEHASYLVGQAIVVDGGLTL